MVRCNREAIAVRRENGGRNSRWILIRRGHPPLWVPVNTEDFHDLLRLGAIHQAVKV